MAKIVIIDDDSALLDTLSDALTGHRIVTHDRLEGASAFVLRELPELLILDVMFPGNPGGGFELARELRRHAGTRELPILFLTGINQELPGDLSARDMGDAWFPVQGFLDKPATLDRLRAKIDELLRTPEGRG